MGAASSVPTDAALSRCLLNAVSESPQQLTLPKNGIFRYSGVPRYNLDIDVKPKAVTYPRTIEEVSAVVGCAAQHGVAVQAISGGHGYGNHGTGGGQEVIVVHMKHFQQFSMDPASWIATIGAGTTLGQVNKKLHAAGGRSIPHGTCLSVGIGGHATIGGFGPASRMWGTVLDHIQEMTVVLANSTVRQTSLEQYPDLFFALRGAASSFGIVTQFKFVTRPVPPSIQFAHSIHSGSYASMADTFKIWQRIVTHPGSPRKLFTQVEINGMGMTISGTYFGSQAEFEQERFWRAFFSSEHTSSNPFTQEGHASQTLLIPRQPTSKTTHDYTHDWPGLVQQWGGGPLLGWVRHTANHFYHKSTTLTNSSLLTDEAIDELFTYFDTARKGTPAWFIIFDLEGGATNDVPHSASGFAHRTALIYLQSYATNPFGRVSVVTKDFVRSLHRIVENRTPSLLRYGGIYPGYVDPELHCPQKRYWGDNLQKLKAIKYAVDPLNVLRNPQSIVPAPPAND